MREAKYGKLERKVNCLAAEMPHDYYQIGCCKSLV